MSGTHRDLLIWSKSGWFASKNQTWGLGPIETSDSDANHAVLHAQNDRWVMGPVESSNSSTIDAVLHEKPTDKGWDPYREVILLLSTLFYMHKMTGHICDQ